MKLISWLKLQVRLNGLPISDRELIPWLSIFFFSLPPQKNSLLIIYYLNKMNLFARIQPQKTFHITIKAVAKLLGISPKTIVRIEKWEYVLFVHRRDIGGQFVSYRKLRNWQNAVAIKIKTCYKKQKLETLWLTIQNDSKKYAKQYQKAYHDFVKQVWNQQWDKLTEAFRPRLTATG